MLVPLSELRKTWRRYYPITLDGRQSSTRRYFWTIDLQRYGVPLFYGGQMFIGISGTLLRRFARPIDWAAFRQRLAEGS
ncbi:MAG: hypothetical protein M9936_14325 [Caldilinea sp.]|nr:hypothetical protein [Caldilineaceae bacterium]MCO5210865.1 hypothetical protein [Caldilinea sp.]MCW5842699.1 hypothetical protein [Caldilinea sp.]